MEGFNPEKLNPDKEISEFPKGSESFEARKKELYEDTRIDVEGTVAAAVAKQEVLKHEAEQREEANEALIEATNLAEQDDKSKSVSKL